MEGDEHAGDDGGRVRELEKRLKEMEEQKETLRVGFMSLDEKHRDLEVKYKNKEREVESLTLKLNLTESNQIMLKQKCEELEGQIRDMQTNHPHHDASADGTATSEADADVVHEFNSERSVRTVLIDLL